MKVKDTTITNWWYLSCFMSAQTLGKLTSTSENSRSVNSWWILARQKLRPVAFNTIQNSPIEQSKTLQIRISLHDEKRRAKKCWRHSATRKRGGWAIIRGHCWRHRKLTHNPSKPARPLGEECGGEGFEGWRRGTHWTKFTTGFTSHRLWHRPRGKSETILRVYQMFIIFWSK